MLKYFWTQQLTYKVHSFIDLFYLGIKYMHVYIYKYMNYMYIIYICIYYICLYISIHLSACYSTYLSMYLYLSIYRYIYIYICKYTYVYIYICTYIYKAHFQLKRRYTLKHIERSFISIFDMLSIRESMYVCIYISWSWNCKQKANLARQPVVYVPLTKSGFSIVFIRFG